MLRHLVEHANQYFIRQKKEWTEILIDFETRNQYQVIDEDQNEVGTISEVSSGIGGFMKRNVFGSHRSLDVRVHDADGSAVVRLARPFFWLFSSLDVLAEGGAKLGTVERRFGLIRKKYDLLDEHGHCFAKISSPLWRLWTFPAEHEREGGTAEVSKKWGGALREIFSDADTFRVAIGSGTWTATERWVLFAAAISIDFDYFENNQGSD